MAVAPDRAGELGVGPSLEEVRELAREHTLVPLRHTFVADTETPVSAYLKLRGSGPSFLLESAEQGQRFGRWSFLGVQPRSVIRLQDGVFTVDGEPREASDPYRAVADELARYKLAAEKVREESAEVIKAVEGESEERIAEEAADVLYHLDVLMASRDLSLAAALEALNARRR